MQPTILNQRYQIEAKIGEGGMAVVYRGRDLRLNRQVAIKVLRPHYSDDADFLSRFQHEAQAAAILNHPYVVKVYDVGQAEHSHYIVMEYVDGENLKTIINRDAPLAVPYAVAIAEAVAYGLEEAHQLGLIHRDIKPQNILVTSDGHVRIADFGIAKSHLSTSRTQAGMTFGTADYLSPEQARGQVATPQSDLYALGVTLFEMLTGRLPFVGNGAMSVVMQHISTEPPRLRQFNPLVPPQLEALVLRAMAKDPHHRPVSARAFAQQLQKYRGVAEQQTIVSPAPADYRDYRMRVQVAPSGRSTPISIPAGTAAPTIHRPSLPPARSVSTRPPQSKGHGYGCGIALIGLLLLVWIMGVGAVFALQIGRQLQPTAVVVLPEPTASPSPAPSSTALLPAPTAPLTLGEVATRVPSSTSLPPDLAPTPLPTEVIEPSKMPPLEPSPLPTVTPVPLAQVPSIIGLSEAQARTLLEQADLIPVFVDAIFDATIPRGFVVSQSSQPGSTLAVRSEVRYVLSQGPELVQLPNLVSVPVGAALSELQGRGLQVETVYRPHALVPRDAVIAQEPVAGAAVEPGDTVFLEISLGDVVMFPEVIGLPRERAEQIILTTELYLEYVDVQGRDRLGAEFDQLAPNLVISAMANGVPVGNNEYVPRFSRIVLGVRAPNDEGGLPGLPPQDAPVPPTPARGDDAAPDAHSAALQLLRGVPAK